MAKITAYFFVFFLYQAYVCAMDTTHMSLDQYLQQQGVVVTEGHICRSNDAKVKFFQELFRKEKWIHTIGEIGFNAGHSSDVFLSSCPGSKIISFDIMLHPYARVGKQYIDEKYPGRHELIEGNSLSSVPLFSKNNPLVRFDMIFIDGGHDFNTAYNDMLNIRQAASQQALVVIDDMNLRDVAAAWKKCVSNGYAKEIQRYEYNGKAWIVGAFVGLK